MALFGCWVGQQAAGEQRRRGQELAQCNSSSSSKTHSVSRG